MHEKYGILYIVATPIGNLDDFSKRGHKILSEATWVAAEDTRHSRILLEHLGIKKSLLAYHAHNEQAQAAQLIQRLLKGESGCLISDAGTPLISDPGHVLVNQAYAKGIKVVPIPGPCAAMTALSGLGVGAAPFYFEGFLPAKATLRAKRLAQLTDNVATLIFYEAPHRIGATLDAMKEAFGDHRFAGIGREMTKKFESFYRGNLSQLTEILKSGEIPIKGEFVIVVQGAPATTACPPTELEHLLTILLTELPLKQAVTLTTQWSGSNKNEVYDMALALKAKLKA